MKSEDIAKLKPGQDIDYWIATKVMGHILEKCDFPVFSNSREWIDAGQYYIVEPGGIDELPHYSTDMTAAWLVVERLEAMRPDILTDIRRISHNGKREGLQWAAHMRVISGKDISFYELEETAPLAICRAALMALTGETLCPDCEGAGELAGDYFADDGMATCERCKGKGVIKV